MKWLVLLFLLSSGLVQASEIGETVGYSVPIENAVDGQVICKENNKFELCSTEYSVNMAGVYNEKPAIYLDDNISGNKPLVSTGKAWVLVEGNIKKGDYITSGKTLGVAKKAERTGVILGIAMEDNISGKIPVLVGIKSMAINLGTGGNVWDSVKRGFIFPNIDALSSLRYWLAILICIVSFTIGFVYFGRISKTGIEAMGRNPLAGKMIQINIVLNMILIALIMIGGLALAYAIVVI